ncbi:MAG: hypothetical protein LBN27_06350 [Prevotellaceae bacterium]|jgi:hypothetical protein|nr:hypothetical protein [Prevotellaceae bacterium]
MSIEVLNEPVIKNIDWINPHSITLEEYRREMHEAENSGDISFEQFQKNMHEWLIKSAILSTE